MISGLIFLVRQATKAVCDPFENSPCEGAQTRGDVADRFRAPEGLFILFQAGFSACRRSPKRLRVTPPRVRRSSRPSVRVLFDLALVFAFVFVFGLVDLTCLWLVHGLLVVGSWVSYVSRFFYVFLLRF